MASSIKNTIQGLYDETFRTVVLPAFERSSREMFRQLDDAFRRGINECKMAHTIQYTPFVHIAL